MALSPYYAVRDGIIGGDVAPLQGHIGALTRNEAQSFLPLTIYHQQPECFSLLAQTLFPDVRKRGTMVQKYLTEVVENDYVDFLEKFFGWVDDNDVITAKLLCTSIESSSPKCFEYMLPKASNAARATALMQALRTNTEDFADINALVSFLSSSVSEAPEDEKVPVSFFINRLAPIISKDFIEDVVVEHVKYMEGCIDRKKWEGADSFILSLDDDMFTKVYDRIPSTLRDNLPSLVIRYNRDSIRAHVLGHFNGTRSKRPIKI